MDFAAFDTAAASEGAVLELRDPAGAPLVDEDNNNAPVTITVLGGDSDVAVKERNSATNRILKQRGRGLITAESSQADGIRLLAKCTKAWSGIKVSGEVLECTYDNAVKFYTAYPFVRDQVDEFMGDRANFLRK
jgi:hypothetical protein